MGIFDFKFFDFNGDGKVSFFEKMIGHEFFQGEAKAAGFLPDDEDDEDDEDEDEDLDPFN